MTSCGTEVPDASRFVIPILDECVEDIKRQASLVEKHEDIQYNYAFADVKLESHPGIIGQLEISSNTVEPTVLESYANSLLYECYPEARTTIARIGIENGVLSSILASTNGTANRRRYLVEGPDGSIYVFKNEKSE